MDQTSVNAAPHVHCEPSLTQILDALARVCTSAHIKSSARMVRFLQYIVTETIEGRSDRIKSYAIGLEVFGKSSDFDAASDTVVRTTATRLRAALDRYYASAGADDPVMIHLPKGRYVPEFRLRQDAPCNNFPEEQGIPTAAPVDRRSRLTDRRARSSWFNQLSKARRVLPYALGILLTLSLGMALYQVLNLRTQRDESDLAIIVPPVAVKPVGKSSTKAELVDAAAAISDRLADVMSTFGDTRIVRVKENEPVDMAVKLQTIPGQLDQDVFVLNASAGIEKDQGVLFWRLTDSTTNDVLWAESEPFSLSKADEPDRVASAVAAKLLGSNGAVPIVLLRLHPSPSEGAPCLSRAQRINIDARKISFDLQQQDIVQCLEESVSQSPARGEAWAVLSQYYTASADDQPGRGKDPAVFEQKAQAALANAMRLSPELYETQQARLLLAFSQHKIEEFDQLRDDLLKRYSGDPGLKMKIGNRLIRLGQPDEGEALMLQGAAQETVLNPADYTFLTWAAYEKRDYIGAANYAARSGDGTHYVATVVLAALYGQLGRTGEATAALSRLLALRPNYGRYFYDDMAQRGMLPTVAEHLADGLRRAGLDIPLKVTQ